MEKQTQDSKRKLSTGIEGLDVILSGGLPSGRTIVITGGPGTGKSILCSQFLKHGIEKNNEPSIYLSLDYTKKAFVEDMKNFGWDFNALEQNGKFMFLEGNSIRHIHTSKESDDTYSPDDLTLEDLMELVGLNVEKIGAKRIVIDDLTALTFRFPDRVNRRSAILSLIEELQELGLTALIISEASLHDFNREIHAEEYLSDGVIGLYVLKDGTRAIQISKMRGMPIDNKPHPYAIVENSGIEVFPDESIFH